MKGKGLLRICTVFLVIISMLAMNIPMAFAAGYTPTVTVKVNPVGTADTVTVKGTTTSYVYAGDIVKVYRVSTSSTAYTSGTLIGQAVATGSGKTAQAVVSVGQLGTTAGFVQIYVTTNGSDPRFTAVGKPYTTKKPIGKSDPFTKTVPASVYANNYADLDDLVGVNVSDTTKYPDGSIVKVYRSSTSKVVLGTGVLSGGKVGIEIPQLGTRAGSVYVSVTKSVYYSESTRLAVAYASEVSESIVAGAVAVVNNHDTDPASPTDTVTITASKLAGTKVLKVGDVINVYRGVGAGSVLIGTSGELTDTGNVTIDLTQDLGVKASKLYISRTSSGKKPSARTAVSYKAENTSKALVPAQIAYVNNRYGTADTIDVTSTVASNVYLGAVLRFYEEIGGGSPVISTTVTDAVYTRIALPADSKFLDASGGTFYASIERKNEMESNRVAVKYKGETPLTTAELESIYHLNDTQYATVTNNPEGTADEITLDSVLAAGDILRLYTTDKTTDKDVIGEATSTGTSATITIAQLPKPTVTTAVYGTVFLTITPVNSTESARYGLGYTTDTGYTGITAVASNVSNADGSTMDTIKVSGLSQYDTVLVYDASTGGSLLGSEIVGAGNTSATINLLLPSTSGGTVYVAVIKLGADENKNRLAVTYTAEP